MSKVIGKPFKKGQSGNPAGRAPGTTTVPKEMKIINNRLIADTVAKYLTCTGEELQEHIRNRDTIALDLMILKVMYEAIRKSDQSKMNALLERMVGKVPDRIDHTTNGKNVNVSFVSAKPKAKDDEPNN